MTSFRPSKLSLLDVLCSCCQNEVLALLSAFAKIPQSLVSTIGCSLAVACIDWSFSKKPQYFKELASAFAFALQR